MARSDGVKRHGRYARYARLSISLGQSVEYQDRKSVMEYNVSCFENEPENEQDFAMNLYSVGGVTHHAGPAVMCGYRKRRGVPTISVRRPTSSG